MYALIVRCGLTMPQIAKRLGISAGCTRIYLVHVFQAFDVRTVPKLIVQYQNVRLARLRRELARSTLSCAENRSARVDTLTEACNAM